MRARATLAAGAVLAMVVAACAPTVSGPRAEVAPDTYTSRKHTHGVVLMSVDWSRRWGFCGFDSVQLRTFTFDRMPVAKQGDDPADLVVGAPASLPAGPGTVAHYALVVAPGEYALTSSQLRAARSASDVDTLTAGRHRLVPGGKPIAGTFTVGATESVYVGHFGLECIDGRPTMWRYYVEGRDGFRNYLETRVKPKYPFLDTAKVQYRLFRTTLIGRDYELR